MIILVVEDEELLSSLLVEELGEAGHVVLGPAETASEALGIISEGEMPELAFVDIRLKDGSYGIEFAREAKRRFGLPCIFVSGEMSDALKHRELALGYIQKPYRTSTVVDSVAVAQDLADGIKPPGLPDGLMLFH